MPSRDRQLKITEVFHSLQGEARFCGWPTVFIRLTGCPLRCQYCDSEYAFYGGEWRDFDALLDEVAGYKARHVCVTGGEPLAQKQCGAFLTELCDAGYAVSLETSGAMDISAVDPRVVRVLDLKTPDSDEVQRNRWENLECLDDQDMIKFVVCSWQDFQWVLDVVQNRKLTERFECWVSPSFGQVEPSDLADWLLASGVNLRFQLQMHKYLWGDVAGK